MTWKPILLAALIGLAAAALFVALATPNLAAQGLYEDEALQAAGSFAYIGGPPIGSISVFGLPVLTGSYLGAIKTGIYGIYLRITGRPFTVVSWRMVGILAVALGIVLLSLLAARALPPACLAAGLLLFVTDCSVVLLTRHDWGPVALATVFRVALIGLLLRDEPDDRAARRNNFAAGALVGLAVFEKLSSVALLGPVVLALILQPFRRKRRSVAALVYGGLLGGLPLIGVNLISLRYSGALVSFSKADARLRPAPGQFLRAFFDEILSTGAAPYARATILGDGNTARESRRETELVAALLATTLAIAAWKFRRRPEFGAAAVLALSVPAIAVALFALPQRTAIHHHIQVVPFTYLAAAAALAGLTRLKAARLSEKAAGAALAAAMLLLLANHAYALARVEASLAAGRTGLYFDHAFSSVGYFAAAKRNEAVFLLADWGTEDAIRCLGQGDPFLAQQVSGDYHGPQDLERAREKAHRKIVYVVTPTRTGVAPETAARINRDAAALPGWTEVAPEPEAAALAPLIVVRKFEVR